MKRFHLKLSVRGALCRTNHELAQEWGGCITIAGVTLHRGKDIRAVFLAELDQGHEVLPMTDGDAEDLCPDFDFTGLGCPGHVVEETGETAG